MKESVSNSMLTINFERQASHKMWATHNAPKCPVIETLFLRLSLSVQISPLAIIKHTTKRLQSPICKHTELHIYKVHYISHDTLVCKVNIEIACMLYHHTSIYVGDAAAIMSSLYSFASYRKLRPFLLETHLFGKLFVPAWCNY